MMAFCARSTPRTRHARALGRQSIALKIVCWNDSSGKFPSQQQAKRSLASRSFNSQKNPPELSERDKEDRMKEKEAVVATQVGAATNVGLAISKGFIGYTVQSTALMADAVNSASDILTDIVVYLSITEARKAATAARPWGMGKAEPLGALAVGGLLVCTAVGIGYQALMGILSISPETATIDPVTALAAMKDAASSIALPSPGSVPGIAAEVVKETAEKAASLLSSASSSSSSSSSHTDIEAVIGGDHKTNNAHYAALGISAVSIVAKEALYHYSLRVGQRVNSDSVKANAWQHRSDAVVSSAVFVGLAGAMAGYPILDPIAGLLVSGLIAVQGGKTTVDALKDLSDRPANKKETESLRAACLAVPGVLSVESLKARRSGPFLYVECTVGVPGNISASAAHRLAELARSEMMNINKPGHRKVANTQIDVEPIGSAGLGERSPLWARDHDSIAEAVTKSVLALENITAVSEVQVYYRDDGRLALKVDVSMNPELSIKAAHRLAVLARVRIEQDLPGVGYVDVDLELEEGEADYPPSMTQTQAAKIRMKDKDRTTTTAEKEQEQERDSSKDKEGNHDRMDVPASSRLGNPPVVRVMTNIPGSGTSVSTEQSQLPPAGTPPVSTSSSNKQHSHSSTGEVPIKSGMRLPAPDDPAAATEEQQLKQQQQQVVNSQLHRKKGK